MIDGSVKIDEPFDNAARRSLRVLLWLGAAFGALAAASLAIVAARRHLPAMSDDAAAGLLIVGAIAVPVTISLLISAAFTVPPARTANRAFAAFGAGTCLARWDVDAATWSAFIDGEARRGRSAANVAFAIVFGSLLMLSIVCGAAGSDVRSTQVKIGAAAVAITLALGGLSLEAARAIGRRRIARRRGMPARVYIGERAVYCAGAFNFWDAQLRALRSVEIEPSPRAGEPARLVFVVGLSRGGRSLARAADLAATVAARPIATSDFTIRTVVPVPPGHVAEAEAIVDRLRAQL